MSLLPFILIAIGVVIISMIFFILSRPSNKSNLNNKPYGLSLSALGVIVLTWVIYLAALYLTDLSTVIRFAPVWFIVSILGFIAAYKEFRNNRAFAVVIGGGAIITFIVGMLFWGLGNM